MRSEEMCDNEAEQHDWRPDVLEFIRDHVDPREAYQLSEADLVFSELRPERAGRPPLRGSPAASLWRQVDCPRE